MCAWPAQNHSARNRKHCNCKTHGIKLSRNFLLTVHIYPFSTSRTILIAATTTAYRLSDTSETTIVVKHGISVVDPYDRSGDSRAASEDATWLRDRGSRANARHYLVVQIEQYRSVQESSVIGNENAKNLAPECSNC